MSESSAPPPAAASEAKQLERVSVQVFDDARQACVQLADEIQSLLESRSAEGRRAVLGLATGSTPVGLYRELVRRHREEGLSFANAVTFNLDEYYPIDPRHRESYRRYMQTQLFDHVDIDESRTHVPDGSIPRSEVFAYCRDYERRIAEAGGIDLQVLGIGRTGHIGFNEPGSLPDSRTRLVTLDTLTRRDAARDFLGEENTPRYAITMGIGAILEARRIVLLAWGSGKAGVVAAAAEGEPTPALPASLLQRHSDAVFYVDREAAQSLARFSRPWLVGPVAWTDRLERKAVFWLSQTARKPLLKLLDEDYNQRGLGELLVERGRAYDLNIKAFNEAQHAITGWPGGKPKADDANRPERASPHPKRSLFLATEPLDDVLYAGGTLHRLVDQGHDTRVVYLTSGNLAVPDEEAEMVGKLAQEIAAREEGPASLARQALDALEAKRPEDLDSPPLRALKSLIRRSEARMACQTCGLAAERIQFLDLPYYETGSYRNFSYGEEDLSALAEVLNAAKPHQIYASGFEADPASNHGTAAALLRETLERLGDEPWMSDCRLWLYAYSLKEWELWEIDMAVPLSPDELANKTKAIFKHQSQRSQSPSELRSGGDAWRQIEAINQATAEAYDQLGLAEYEAIECFKRWR